LSLNTRGEVVKFQEETFDRSSYPVFHASKFEPI
jgi:hypothetical protein